MIQLEASIYDSTSASLQGDSVVMQPHDANVYTAILREVRNRASSERQVVQLHANDLTRGVSEAIRVHPDGSVEQQPHGSPPPPPPATPQRDRQSPQLSPQQTLVGPPPAHTFVREVQPVPEGGFRRLLYKVSAGSLNLGPSPEEARRRDMIAAVRTRATEPEVVAVICLKGGIGKTSTTAGVGLTLAHYRGDRVIALDANPDAGDLYERTCPGSPPATLTDLADRAAEVQSMTDLARFTGIADRLSVIAGDQEPTISESLSADDFVTALKVVQHYYNVVMVDCGTGVTHPSMLGILGSARHIIIAGGYAVSGARRAENSLRWLHGNGYEDLARNATVVLTQTATVSSIVDTASIEATLAQMSSTVIAVPHDQAVADGTTISLDRLQPRTADAYLQIAASIARSFR